MLARSATRSASSSSASHVHLVSWSRLHIGHVSRTSLYLSATPFTPLLRTTSKDDAPREWATIDIDERRRRSGFKLGREPEAEVFIDLLSRSPQLPSPPFINTSPLHLLRCIPPSDSVRFGKETRRWRNVDGPISLSPRPFAQHPTFLVSLVSSSIRQKSTTTSSPPGPRFPRQNLKKTSSVCSPFYIFNPFFAWQWISFAW